MKNTKQINLFHAAKYGNIEEATKMLDLGADIDGVDSRGLTALCIAVWRATNNKIYNIKFITFLLEKKAKTYIEKNFPPSPLYYINSDKHFTILEILIENNINLNVTFCSDETILHRLALTRQVKIAKLLTDNNADVNMKDSSGRTPLDIATERFNNKMVEFLLSKMPKSNSQ